MNIAQLLSYGPKLTVTYCSSRPKTERSTHRVGDKTIELYKSMSVDGLIWTTLIAPKLGINTASASGNLRELMRRGFLEECGKLTSSRSSNKPILYRWTDGGY